MDVEAVSSQRPCMLTCCQVPLWKRRMAVPVANGKHGSKDKAIAFWMICQSIIPQFFQFDTVNHPKHRKRHCCILPAQVDVEGNTPLHVAVEAH